MKSLQRLEALGVLVVAVALYARSDYGWGMFAALLLVPDLSLLAYLGGARIGAYGYNAAHSYIGPIAMLAVAPPVALIWLAHCGMDRALGYGLKYTTGFRDTHLGRIGRAAA